MIHFLLILLIADGDCMQNVSKEYKQSMRTYVRNRGYIKATIGIYNLQAQKNVQINKDKNDLLYFSNIKEPFAGSTVERVYVTPEQKFSKVDGSMYFAPPPSTAYEYYNNGIISNDILGSIYIDFGEEEYDIKGLTIDFSEYYPVDFIIETNQTKKTYTGNDKRNWRTEDVFENTSFFLIKPTQMVNGAGRLRIFQFSCGITNTFVNDEIISYSGKEYISPICETIPSNDVNLTVANYNLYYSPDNPESALAYMETGQEIRVAFGYDVNGNGNIEWIPEKLSYLKEWSANESKANFISTDIFDNMSGTYYKGVLHQEGITLYDLAKDVLNDAGITNYSVDNYLKKVIVKNPIPAVSHSTALQIIANAGRSVLYEDREGKIVIHSAFVPKITITADNQTWYSSVENVLKDGKKTWYATASKDFTVVDGNMRFLPNQKKDLMNTGYISESVWRENGKTDGYWEGEIPIITINFESIYTIFGLSINFKEKAPKQFYINTYREGEIINHIEVENPNTSYQLNHEFFDFDQMEFIFTKGIANSRLFINDISIGKNTDYILRRTHELITAPIAKRQNKIKDISVSFSTYEETMETVVVASEEIKIPYNGYEYVSYFKNPSYGLFLFISENKEESRIINAKIIESGNYYAKIKFTGIMEELVVAYSISGYEYKVEEQKYLSEYNKNGENITWNNPLVSTLEHAKMIEEWIAAYFLGDVDYQIEWTGDPSVDADDLFELETKYGNVFIKNYENTLNFNGRWKGSMKARKVVK